MKLKSPGWTPPPGRAHTAAQGMPRQPDNIFAGTQVVSLVEVRGTNQSRVQLRGGLGIVTQTPTGDRRQFLGENP